MPEEETLKETEAKLKRNMEKQQLVETIDALTDYIKTEMPKILLKNKNNGQRDN